MANAVYTLLCHRDMPMASITLPLLLGFLDESQTLYIIDDGSLLDEDEEIACGWGKNVRVVRRSQREKEIKTKLAGYDACTRYRDEFPLAHKLLDLSLLAQSLGHDHFLYTDSDILYLRDCQGLFRTNANLHLRTDAVKLSVKLSDVFLKFGWEIPYLFNSGFFTYPSGAFDLEFVEYFLAQPDCRHFPWLTEQTCWAVLFGRLPDRLCPDQDQFVCRENFRGPDGETCAVHLIGDLKKRVGEWSRLGMVPRNFHTLRFDSSRHVNIVDWMLKVGLRMRERIGFGV
jgi:hypothetical protein